MIMTGIWWPAICTQNPKTSNMKEKFEDDGRTIASMDTDRFLFLGTEKKSDGCTARKEELIKNQMREVLKGSIKASLVVAGLFSALLIVFVLFCTQIWFK